MRSKIVHQLTAEILERSRHHGKGTFVRAWSDQVRRGLGLLLKVPHAFTIKNVAEFTQGVSEAQTEAGSRVFISMSSPSTWGSEVISALAGVIIVGDAMATEELALLKQPRVKYLGVRRDQLDLRGDCAEFGRELAAALYAYGLTGTALQSHYEVREVSLVSPEEEAEPVPSSQLYRSPRAC